MEKKEKINENEHSHKSLLENNESSSSLNSLNLEKERRLSNQKNNIKSLRNSVLSSNTKNTNEYKDDIYSMGNCKLSLLPNRQLLEKQIKQDVVDAEEKKHIEDFLIIQNKRGSYIQNKESYNGENLEISINNKEEENEIKVRKPNKEINENEVKIGKRISIPNSRRTSLPLMVEDNKNEVNNKTKEIGNANTKSLKNSLIKYNTIYLTKNEKNYNNETSISKTKSKESGRSKVLKTLKYGNSLNSNKKEITKINSNSQKSKSIKYSRKISKSNKELKQMNLSSKNTENKFKDTEKEAEGKRRKKNTKPVSTKTVNLVRKDLDETEEDEIRSVSNSNLTKNKNLSYIQNKLKKKNNQYKIAGVGRVRVSKVDFRIDNLINIDELVNIRTEEMENAKHHVFISAPVAIPNLFSGSQN